MATKRKATKGTAQGTTQGKTHGAKTTRAPEAPPRRRGRPPRRPVEASPEVDAAAAMGAHVIRRYGNRRFYDARLSRSVTVEDIARLIRGGEEVVVVDADNGEDITRRILLQILLEESSGGVLGMLPATMLRALITLRNEQLRQWLEQYLATGARWLEFQMRAMQADPSILEDLMRNFGKQWPWQIPGVPGVPTVASTGRTPEPAPTKGGASGRSKGKKPAAGDKAADDNRARSELEEMWRRLATLQPK